jgi:hypothetical protein
MPRTGKERRMQSTCDERFVHRQNLKLLKEQLEAPVNETQRKVLLRLLVEEEAKAEALEAKANSRPR